jgi:Protein of unknown function (DUF3617)
MLFRVAVAFVLVGLPTGLALSGPKGSLPQAGAYEVRVRLEMPNVQHRAASTATICIPYADGTNGAPFPVLSGNNPLAKCPASNVRRDGAVLRFEILCEGRGAARAQAVYTLEPGAFEGRIAMVMGGKNMTMTEVQIGRRIGPCVPPAASRHD